MFSSFFSPLSIILPGLIAGIIFGFLLQRGKVGRFDTIVSQFLFRDFTVLKIMLSAIVVGGVGVYSLLDLGYISQLPLKTSSLAGSALGGVLFGIGMAILGYCPGTALTALAEGSKDVVFGFFGMLLGTFTFELSYPWIDKNILIYDTNNLTLPALLQLPHWVIFAALGLLAFTLFYFLEKMSWAR